MRSMTCPTWGVNLPSVFDTGSFDTGWPACDKGCGNATFVNPHLVFAKRSVGSVGPAHLETAMRFPACRASSPVDGRGPDRARNPEPLRLRHCRRGKSPTCSARRLSVLWPQARDRCSDPCDQPLQHTLPSDDPIRPCLGCQSRIGLLGRAARVLNRAPMIPTPSDVRSAARAEHPSPRGIFRDALLYLRAWRGAENAEPCSRDA